MRVEEAMRRGGYRFHMDKAANIKTWSRRDGSACIDLYEYVEDGRVVREGFASEYYGRRSRYEIFLNGEQTNCGFRDLMQRAKAATRALTRRRVRVAP